jgi:uncharacterized membrane protein
MNTTMRTTRDRIRHAFLFEITWVILCTPLLSFILNKPMETMGALGIVLSLIAMGWNCVYNVLFDHALLRMGKPLYPRSLAMRIAHALLFEGGFVFVSIPMVMWWLHLSFVKALMFDLAFLVMVPIYTIFYNGIYDRAFPVEGVPACKHGLEGERAGAEG